MAIYQLWIEDKSADLLSGALDDLGQHGGRIEMVGNSPEFVSGSLIRVSPRSMSVGVPITAEHTPWRETRDVLRSHFPGHDDVEYVAAIADILVTLRNL